MAIIGTDIVITLTGIILVLLISIRELNGPSDTGSIRLMRWVNTLIVPLLAFFIINVGVSLVA